MTRLLLAALLASAAPAAALQLAHTGYLLDQTDAPVNASQTFTFQLFAASSGGSALWTGTCALDVKGGTYRALLGGDCGADIPPSAFGAGETRFLEVTVGSTTLSPRCVTGAVPTALTSLDTQQLKADLAAPGGTPLVHWDKLSNVPAGLADGDQDTTYTAGAGLALTGTQFALSNMAGAADGAFATKAADGSLAWTTAGAGLTVSGGALQAVPYTAAAGGGLALASNAFSVQGLAAAPANAIAAKGAGGGLQWLTAGSGLTVSGGTISATALATASPTFTGTTTVDTLAFSASGSLNAPTKATVPGSCTPGELFYVSGTNTFYGCTSAGASPLGSTFGSDASSPATSCNAIKTARPTAASGTYVITAGGSTYSTYCDMTIDSGGWTRIRTHDTPINGQYTSQSQVTYANVVPALPSGVTRILVRMDLDSNYAWASADLGANPVEYFMLSIDTLVQTSFASGRYGLNTTTGTAGTLWYNKWSNCYSPGAGVGYYTVRYNVPNASTFCHGQFAFAAASQVVFNYGAFATSNNDDIGIGNQNAQGADWTSTYLSANFAVRRLSWYVR